MLLGQGTRVPFTPAIYSDIKKKKIYSLELLLQLIRNNSNKYNYK